MIKHILALLTTVVPIYCYAGSAYFGLYTDHAVSGQFNETNSVYMVQSDTGITAGRMINSYGRPSFMFGYTQPSDNLLTFGLVMATGYPTVYDYNGTEIKAPSIIPLPVASINIPVFDSVDLTTNFIGGIVLNAGIRVRF